MLNLTKKEINYILREFTRLTHDLDNMDSIDDRDYKLCLGGIDQETNNDMKNVIENKDKINTDEEINKSCIEGLIWGLSMCVWLDNEDTVNDVRELLGEDTTEEYYTIYAKLIEMD